MKRIFGDSLIGLLSTACLAGSLTAYAAEESASASEQPPAPPADATEQIQSAAPAEQIQSAPPSSPATAAVSAEPGTIEEVLVTGRYREIASDVIAERKEQSVVADFLSAESIARVGDPNVAAALKRLPGITVVRDKFVYVRGLGERYSSSELNGAEVPSPDLSRNVLPLDIFPSSILDSLEVQKGYTPDRSAAFGGGDINIRTRAVPLGPVVNVKVGTGWNTKGKDSGLSYNGGNRDWTGVDDGTRAFPGALKAALDQYQGKLTPQAILQSLNQDGGTHTLAEAQQINRQLATTTYRDTDFHSQTMRPDASFETTLGNRWYFLDDQRLEFGVLGAAGYDNYYRNRPRTNRDATTPTLLYTKTQHTTHQVNSTGVFNLGINYTEDQALQSTNIYLHNTEDDSELRLGCTTNFRCEDGNRLRTYGIRDEERKLVVHQLRGSHTLGEATLDWLPDFLQFVDVFQGLQFNWFWSHSEARTDIPSEIVDSARDFIDPVTFALQSTTLRRNQSAADYRYSDLDDQLDTWGYDLQMPLTVGPADVTLSGGYAYTKKARQYISTRFGFGTNDLAAVDSLVGTPGQVFTDANILDPTLGYVFQVGGTGTESYLAGQINEAVYGKFDARWGENWRLSGGVRWERFDQLSVPYDPLQYDPNIGQLDEPIDQIADETVHEDQFYPALALTYSVHDFWAPDFQFRLGFSQTVTRPDLREISNSIYLDPLTEAKVRGTPGLRTSDVNNYDLRGAWYFENDDTVTVSFFYKDISDAIETVQADASDNDVGVGFVNGDKAYVYGTELESLKNLGFASGLLGEWTEQLFLYGNVTLSKSEIDTGSAAVDLTNRKREMTQHSDWVLNLQLGYDSFNGRHSASVVYNAYGERIFFGGKNGAPDAKEQPFHSLDLVYNFYANDHMSLQFALRNLIDDKTEIKIGNTVVLEQQIGRDISLDLSWKL